MSANRLPLLLAILTLLMGGLALFAFVKLSRARQELALAQQQVLARDRVIIRQQQAGARAVDQAATQQVNPDSVKVEPPAAAVFADELGSLTGDDLSNLMKAGLPDDPEAFLIEDLRKHQAELLPAGTLGGTPRVTDARILTEHFALATYDDGHQGGFVLLRYDVTAPGQITWKRLDVADQ